MAVLLDMAVSVDGYISGKNNTDIGLHNWYFDPSPQDREVIDELIGQTGAIVMGRNTYDMGDRYDGFADNPYKATHFVLTHSVPDQPAKGVTDFVFVTNGIDHALQQAFVAAGGKNVVVSGGAQMAQQFLNSGFITEIQLHIVPVVIGEGIRLFDGIDAQIKLDLVRVIASSGVTHVRYRVNS